MCLSLNDNDLYGLKQHYYVVLLFDELYKLFVTNMCLIVEVFPLIISNTLQIAWGDKWRHKNMWLYIQFVIGICVTNVEAVNEIYGACCYGEVCLVES